MQAENQSSPFSYDVHLVVRIEGLWESCFLLVCLPNAPSNSSLRSSGPPSMRPPTKPRLSSTRWMALQRSRKGGDMRGGTAQSRPWLPVPKSLYSWRGEGKLTSRTIWHEFTAIHQHVSAAGYLALLYHPDTTSAATALVSPDESGRLECSFMMHEAITQDWCPSPILPTSRYSRKVVLFCSAHIPR